MNFSRISKKIFVGTLILALVVPGTFALLPPKKAEAGVSSCVAAFSSVLTAVGVQEGISAVASVPAADNGKNMSAAETGADAFSSQIKDCIEHEVALAFARAALTAMTNETVHWINSGFKGNPTFVTNPDQFLAGVGDQIAGNFILGSPLSFLCSPFKVQIQTTLALNLSLGLNQSDNTYAQLNRCTLSSVTNNVNDVFKDANSGGWSAWMNMALNPANNPIGAYLQANDQINSKIATQQNVEINKLNWGNGFLSMESCKSPDGTSYVKYGGLDASNKSFTNATVKASVNGSNGGSAGGTYSASSGLSGSGDPHSSTYSSDPSCTIETPGTVIASQLNSQLNVPAQQLGLADDLDKVFNALEGQLFKQVFEGAGGLLGSTVGSPGSSRLDILQKIAEASSTDQQAKDKQNLSKAFKDINNSSSPTAPAAPEQNLAINAVSTSYPPNGDGSATNLTDGNKSSDSSTDYNGALAGPSATPTFDIDLGKTSPINQIRIYQRQKPGPLSKKIPFTVQLFTIDPHANPSATPVWTSPVQQQDFGNVILIPVTDSTGKNPAARYIQIVGDASGISGGARLEFLEVEAYPNLPPTINLNGAAYVTTDPGVAYTDQGATAQDAEDGTITNITTDYGGLNPANPVAATTPYTITYTATDSGGLTTTATRQVLVQKVSLPSSGY